MSDHLRAQWREAAQRELASGPYYHGTNQEMRAGDLLHPASFTGASGHDPAEYPYYESTWIYLTNNLDHAMRYARHAVERAGGESRVYEVRPIGSLIPDTEYLMSGFGSDQVQARMGEVVGRVATLTKSASIKSYLETVSEFRRNHLPHSDWKYSSLEEMVLDLGKSFRVGEWEGDAGEVKGCYLNSFRAVVDEPGLNYCEGYATGIIPVHHAWVTDDHHTAFDPTWCGGGNPDIGDEYFGIEFNRRWALNFMASTGLAGIMGYEIPRPEHIALLRDGLPSSAVIR
jgi:hypothetical protein